MRRWGTSVGIFLALLMALATPAWAQTVFRINLDKPIHPISEEYILDALREGDAAAPAFILLEIDTPGGYVSSVETIQRAILASKTPVVAFVTPPGARAASGGALVALACDFIAMAPGTSIGAAHPVSGMPLAPPTPHPKDPADREEEGGKALPSEVEASMQKLVNDLAAHQRSLAVNRGRNAELAEQMIRESISLTEREALEGGVIEMVAKDQSELFAYLENHPVRRFDGTEQGLAAGPNPSIVGLEMSWRQRALCALADPTLAYFLLVLGALGLFIEFKSPGLIFPGVLGGIFVLLYLMSIPVLPVNAVGLLLMLLAVAFFILEVKVVSYGMLSIGGVVALVAGSLMLYRDGPIPELRLSLVIILPVALAFAGIMVFLVVLAARAHRNPVITGEEYLPGQEGEVREPIRPPAPGMVFVFGEYWAAVCDEPLEPGEKVRVVEVLHGMTVRVKRAS